MVNLQEARVQSVGVMGDSERGIEGFEIESAVELRGVVAGFEEHPEAAFDFQIERVVHGGQLT